VKRRVVVVGAGIGGLAAASRLARLGHDVRLFEARAGPGGLASGLHLRGTGFDAGPYVLLDRPGLAWALDALGLDLDEAVVLQRIDALYSVTSDDDEPFEFFADCARTAAAIDRRWPGSGPRYEAFVAAADRVYTRTRMLLTARRRRPLDVLRTGAWRDLPFLLQSLARVLARSGLPRDVVNAIAIWTRIAGQDPAEAPSVMALIPAVIHRAGAHYPRGGISAIPRALADRVAAQGVECHWGVPVRSIRTRDGRVIGVETDRGVTAADAVLSNAHGIGTHLDLLDTVPEPVRRALARLPLQSPGLCAYLRVRTEPRPPYLRFRLRSGRDGCTLLVMPGVVDPGACVDGWWPARLIAPLGHEMASRLGPAGQRDILAQMIDEPWWRAGIAEHEVVGTRVPTDWGQEFRLHRDSMNTVMTARWMRSGRLSHRSPFVDRLYLAGSSTYPGQWVSFCAISGVLAADQLHRDLG
jgi:phytoene dehydrogenase-like protein